MVDYTQVVGNAIKPRSSRNYGRTVIQLDNPASEDCVLTHVYCHATGSGSGKVKIFRDDGTNFVLVAESAISNVAGDNIHEVSLAIEKGDYIAYYFSGYQSGGVPNCDNSGSSAYVDGDVTAQRAKSAFRFRTQSSDIHAGYVARLFQYEVIFDLGHPALADTRALLEAEYAKYYKATAWNITPADPDCFDRLQALGGGLDQTWETGWLCQAIEYGESPCAPLPYWLCPLPTPETIYMRGECTCSNFRDNLQHLGIPCMHLIAARIYYGNEPPWCPYIPCP